MAQSVGAANLASGLQDPFLGRSPVIAITGRKDPIARYRNAYQEILHQGMFDPVTKYNVYVDAAAQLPYLLRQAFRDDSFFRDHLSWFQWMVECLSLTSFRILRL
jgi:acetolactate synthase-1/2/3 large subunit